MIVHDAPLLQSILDQPQSLAATTAQRLAHFTRYQFDPRSDASWEVIDKLWRAALMSRDAERTIPQLTPIAARPIQPPRYHSTPENLASFGLWFRSNHLRAWDYWCALDHAANADPERAGAMDEFWDFARCQFDREVLSQVVQP